MAFDSPPALYYHQDHEDNDDGRSCNDANGCIRSGEKEKNGNAPPTQTQSSSAPVALVTRSVPAVQAAVAGDVSYATASSARFHSHVAPLSGTSHGNAPARSKDIAELRSEIMELIFAIRECNEKIALIEANGVGAGNSKTNTNNNAEGGVRVAFEQKIVIHKARLAEIAGVSPVLAGFIHKREHLAKPRSEIQQRTALIRTRANLQSQLDDGRFSRKEWNRVQKQIDDIEHALAEDSGTAVLRREQARMPHEREKRLHWLLRVTRDSDEKRGEGAHSELAKLLASQNRMRGAQKKRERDRRDNMRNKKAWPLTAPQADEEDYFAVLVGGLLPQEVSEMEKGIEQAEFENADHLHAIEKQKREERIEEETIRLEKEAQDAYARALARDEYTFEPASRVEYRAREPGWRAEDEPLPGDPFDVDTTDLAAARQWVVQDLAAISTGRKPPWKLPDTNLKDPAAVREAMRNILREASKRAA